MTEPTAIDARTGQLDPAGLHSPVLFGPTEDFACSCGERTGERHAGETCERCGVELARRAERTVRHAHIATPGGLVHPALAPAIGALLGISAADVLAVARVQAYFDTDGRVVHVGDGATGAVFLDRAELTGALSLYVRLTALGGAPSEADLILGSVPVLPPSERPLLPAAGGGRMVGPIDDAYRQLVLAQKLLTYLTDAEEPGVVCLPVTARLQLAFERLIEVVATGGDAELGVEGRAVEWMTERPPQPPFGFDDDFHADLAVTAIACALVGERSVLIQGAYATVFLAPDGELSAVATAGLRLMAASASGRFLLFVEEGLGTHGIYDRALCTWLPAPAGVDFPRGIVVERDEDTFLVDRRGRTRRADRVVDCPSLYAMSPDTRFVLVTDKQGAGGIYECATGRCHLEHPELLFGRAAYSDLVPLTGSELASDAGFDDRNEVFTPALALGPDARWRIFDGVTVLRGQEPWFALGAGFTCGSFDATGESLFVVRGGEGLILGVAGREPKILARLDLTPAMRALSWPSSDGIGGGALARAAWRFGTMEAAARASDEELGTIEGMTRDGLARLRSSF